jgi:hypothetical protein
LFNQSFDSFGDGHYFTVDATLNNDSFGIGLGRTGSVDPDGTTQILHSSSNFSQQLLASASGALTIGHSPVNSFGQHVSSPGARRGASTMVVGGPDARATSPTEALGMNRSYSAGAHSMTRPLDDCHLRMSVGSFGAPLPYSRSYGDNSPGPMYAGGRSHEGDKGPAFYSFLQKYKAAFLDCSFLLPGLKAALLEPPLNSNQGALPVDGAMSQKWEPTVSRDIGMALGTYTV